LLFITISHPYVLLFTHHPRMSLLLEFLRGSFPFCGEFMVFGMAMEAAVSVRATDDAKLKKDKKSSYNWFLTLLQITLVGFGGGVFMPIMLGLPSSFLIGADVNAAGCILSWWLVFHSPGDFFYRNIARNLPFQIFYVSGAQLFRSSGVWGFVDKGLGMMKPSPYYPIPLLGPILTASLLSNVGPIFRLGYTSWFANGVTANFQYSFVLATFYHLYANDTNGVLGNALRVPFSFVSLPGFLSDKDFASCAVTAFMVVWGCLKLPGLLGPNLDPLKVPSEFLMSLTGIGEANNRKAAPSKKETPKRSKNRGKSRSRKKDD